MTSNLPSTGIQLAQLGLWLNKAMRRGGGRRKGSQGYSTRDTKHLLDLVDDMKPGDREGWEHVSSNYNNHYAKIYQRQARLPENLKKKFFGLVSYRAVDEQVDVPEEVRRAQAIVRTLSIVRFGEEEVLLSVRQLAEEFWQQRVRLEQQQLGEWASYLNSDAVNWLANKPQPEEPEIHATNSPIVEGSQLSEDDLDAASASVFSDLPPLEPNLDAPAVMSPPSLPLSFIASHSNTPLASLSPPASTSSAPLSPTRSLRPARSPSKRVRRSRASRPSLPPQSSHPQSFSLPPFPQFPLPFVCLPFLDPPL